jgi:hypothetical protein
MPLLASWLRIVADRGLLVIFQLIINYLSVDKANNAGLTIHE